MRIIGVTGGAGSGKSTVCRYLSEILDAPLLIADDVGHKVMEPETDCYKKIVEIFGKEILLRDGFIDRKKLAAIVFCDDEKLEKLNAIVHPAVDEVINEYTGHMKKAGTSLLFIETALPNGKFIECCDEIWFVRTDTKVRVKRLMDTRGYSKKRCEEIIADQPSDEKYMELSCEVIENSAQWKETKDAIRELCKRKFG